MGATINLNFLKMFENDFHLLSDFADFFCGKFIGSGESRQVYEFGINSKLVVKIDTSKEFYNVAEWETYTNIIHHFPEYKIWFAKPIQISSCGRVMLQQRTYPTLKLDSANLPKEIPHFFCDFKIENWGTIGKRVCCHDYANTRIYGNVKNVEMVKPEWWSLHYQGALKDKSNEDN